MRSPSARYLVVYFHCNGVDLGMCRGFCNVLRKQFRVHVLAVEYPGYGAWHAATTPETIVDAAGSALDFIVEHLQWPLDSVMIFGRSIGTGPAMAIAGNQPLAGLILVSPFLSIQELIRDRIGGLAGFCEDFFVSKDTAPKVKCPTFILHGEADEVVCNTHGKMLYKMLLSRKLLVVPADMRHNSSLLGNLQHFVLPMFHFFSLPEQCTRELQVPIWAWHRRLVAQQAQHPVATRLLSEDFSVHDTSARDAPCEDCGEAVEVDSLSSKTTSESYSQQPAPAVMSTTSWPEMPQPHRSSRVHFMRQGRLHIAQAVLELAAMGRCFSRCKWTARERERCRRTKRVQGATTLKPCRMLQTRALFHFLHYCQLSGTSYTSQESPLRAHSQ
ncbi:aho-3 [Symbiodinium sp. KB8]|nr:aho-3 [Symbiodinium sp. KB8]